MKLFLFILFLFFYPLFSQSQIGILVKNSTNLDRFDWSAFSNKTNIEENINYRERRFYFWGADSFVVDLINYDKKQLTQLEMEFTLYTQGIKSNFPGDMEATKEALKLYWESIKNVENQIQIRAGLRPSGTPLVGTNKTELIRGGEVVAREGTWELYKADHEIVLNLVDKKDKNLYNLLNRNDEDYAEFISPYVERYIGEAIVSAQAYSESWKSTHSSDYPEIDSNMLHLKEMYINNLELYNCFNKNFNTTGDHQQALVEAMQGWRTKQGQLGVDVFIQSYKNHELSPNVAVRELLRFREASDGTKEKLEAFYRDDILNNENFIDSNDRIRKEARVRALIGLRNLDVLTGEENIIFDKALKEGIIVNINQNPLSFYGLPRPLPLP